LSWAIPVITRSSASFPHRVSGSGASTTACPMRPSWSWCWRKRWWLAFPGSHDTGSNLPTSP